jgi:adenylate cyclase
LVSRLRGITPYDKNPQLCTQCEKRIQGTEERVVTTMFVDIRESTALSARLPRDEYIGLLRNFFKSATAPVYDSYGVVDRFLGDGMVVFFNAPVPRDSHVEDALKAALTIQRELAHAPFGVGIGIETGLTTVGNPGLGDVVDFTCLGDSVNAASRLQALAGAGEIIVGPSAWPGMSDLVEMRGVAATAELADLKGIGRVEVHRLHIID